MFQFENIKILYLLFAIPIFVVIFMWGLHVRKMKMLKFGDLPVIKRLLISYSTDRPVFKFVLEMFALALLIFALANPQFGSKLKDVKRQGVEIMVALDVSNSMNARDISPDRLSKAKRSIELFINKLDGDMLGLVVFAGDAYIQIPMTDDYASSKMYLKSINTDIVPLQGTDLSEAISMSANAFSQDPESGKIIILISDGENHEDDALQAAQAAHNEGVLIYTVGMGTREGAPIPAKGGGFHKDEDGNVVISKLNESSLAKIAAAGAGKYVLAGKNGSGLDLILDEISKMNKTEHVVEVYSEFDDQYQYPLGLAMVILFVEILIGRRRKIKIHKFLES